MQAEHWERCLACRRSPHEPAITITITPAAGLAIVSITSLYSSQGKCEQGPQDSFRPADARHTPKAARGYLLFQGPPPVPSLGRATLAT